MMNITNTTYTNNTERATIIEVYSVYSNLYLNQEAAEAIRDGNEKILHRFIIVAKDETIINGQQAEQPHELYEYVQHALADITPL